MEFSDDRHDQLYQYWLLKKGENRAPARSDIDPLDFQNLLPNIFLFDVIKDPLDYRMRLVGTRIVQVMERDCTGMLFDEIYKGERALKVREDYDWVAKKMEPVYSEITAGWMNRDFLTYYRLMLPLSSDNSDVDMMLGLTTFINKKKLIP